MNCSPRLWNGVDSVLAERRPGLEIRHWVPDMPSIEECAKQLLDWAPRRFALCGLSLGGILAMAVVRHAPERVTRLALLSTNPRAPRAEQYTAWKAQRAQLASGATPRDLQRDLLPVLLRDPVHDVELRERALTMADDIPVEVLDSQLAMQATRIDERSTLAMVSVPTLVLAAAEDRLCSVDLHEEMHQLVRDSRLVTLERAAHLSPLEEPSLVADELAAWLG